MKQGEPFGCALFRVIEKIYIFAENVEYAKNGEDYAAMIPRIKQFELNDNWKLIVTFDDGFRVCYDVKDDIVTIEDFRSLATEIGLWPMAQLDASRTCISWNECIDLPSDTIYEYGIPILEL